MRMARTGKGRRLMRHSRLRRRLTGTPERPRLAVFRSLKHMYAQVIDDTRGITLAAASSLERQIDEQRDGKSKIEVSRAVGQLVAQRAREKGINSVVFDRGGYKYHGRTKALADAAREEGLVF